MSVDLLPRLRARGVATPDYDLNSVEIGVAHIGLGAFHRAHQAVFFDDALRHSRTLGICATSPHDPAAAQALAAQDGLFTVTTCAAARETRVVGAIRAAFAPADPGFIARASAPTTRLITLTVTEKGYCRAGDGGLDVDYPGIRADLAGGAKDQTMPGLLVRILEARRAAAAGPVAVVSCDNLPGNGAALRRVAVEFARARNGGLGSWIEDHVLFPDTMVDSITPASDAALHAHLEMEYGVSDACAVQREPFSAWVIDRQADVFAPELAGAGVVFAKDVSAHERAKLRLLNGPHSALAYLGLLCGRSTVAEAMDEPDLAAFVRAMMDEEIAPLLSRTLGPEPSAYSADILARFRNPGIVHRLSQIAMDGSQKLPVRIVASMAEAIAAGRKVDRLGTVLGAWFRFAVREAAAGRTLQDPLGEAMLACARKCTGDAEADALRLLAVSRIAEHDLGAHPAFRQSLIQGYVRAQTLEREGPRALRMNPSAPAADPQR